MNVLTQNLMALGRGRLIALGATGVGLVLLLVLGLGTVMTPSFRPLYGDLDPASASRIVSTLEQAGFRVELDRAGSVVSVPEADIARARMTLADQGLPSQGTPGWELFDDASGLGMNTFMQRVNRLRALEGELSRSVRTIDGIEAARVHLVIPEREAFSRTRPEATASVIVRSRAGYAISRRQALAIRALVASAVPDMSPGAVTVLSASGETILGRDSDLPGEAAVTSDQAAMEERLSRSVTEILAARVGAANVRVQARVDLSTERQVIRQESFDPDQQVIRSTETREEATEGSEAAAGQVGVANQLPPELADAAEDGPRSSSRSTQSDEIVNYEIGSTLSETVREPGDVERVSVAVLVNGIYETGPNGAAVYRERTPEEIERIERLVRSAIGFDAERGDTVSVESLQFMTFEEDTGLAQGSLLGDLLARNMMSILRGVLALAIVVAILVFAVRPALRRALDAPPAPAPDADAAALPKGEAAPQQVGTDVARPQIPANPGRRMITGDDGRVTRIEPALDGIIDDDAPDDLVSLASVRGGVRRRRVQSVGELVDAEPDESIRVLRHWLAEGA
ncbi:flagellar basal-body MS-ring/collar protein FliF [Roseivivax isoporae]|uniref:Flagellar M-ring protein n=1 Tax=Roseivivax isoporae LMG 25204 TaxID=1449351 RepID=X7F7J6_9RHOB|nr:flagellar basal-body MS-ring/collar protein FliF [Roseivivax isoporae]ETX28907.1 flagellar M-ring protein [Roseivivax isoporae LMG 25204]